MKKTTKSMLITALILVCAGLLLSLGSFLFALISKVDIFGVENVPYISATKDYTLTEILESSPEADYTRKLTSLPFSKLDILSFVGKVEIVPTKDETHVTLTNANPDNVLVQVIGTTLTVAEQREVGIMGVFIGEKGFSFKGLRQIFGPGNSANPGKAMTVYLNEDDLAESVSIRSSVGDVVVRGIGGDSLSVRASFGKASLEDLTVKHVEVMETFGTLTLKGNECSSINATVHFGSVEAFLPQCGDQSLVLDLWAGKCTVSTEAPLTHYKLTLSTTVGSVEKNGKSAGKTMQEYSGTASRISSTVLLGKISVNGSEEAEAVQETFETEEVTFEVDTVDTAD